MLGGFACRLWIPATTRQLRTSARRRSRPRGAERSMRTLGQGSKYSCRNRSPTPKRRAEEFLSAAFCRRNGPNMPIRGPKVDVERRHRGQLAVGCRSPAGRVLRRAVILYPRASPAFRQNMPENRPKISAGNTGTARRTEPPKRLRRRLTIVNAAPYVGRMTKAANEGGSRACQGLHNGPVLAYGSSRTVRLTVPCHVS